MSDERRRTLEERRAEQVALARAALERATDGDEPRTAALLAGVPGILAEARRRRGTTDVLAAGVQACRRAIPRFAAAAAVLVAIGTALLLTGGNHTTDAATTWEDVLVAGDGVSDEMLLGSMLDAETEP